MKFKTIFWLCPVFVNTLSKSTYIRYDTFPPKKASMTVANRNGKFRDDKWKGLFVLYLIDNMVGQSYYLPPNTAQIFEKLNVLTLFLVFDN